MNKKELLSKALSDPRWAMMVLLGKFHFMFNDETYLKLRWRLKMGTKLHLENPQLFNEKLQWLKLHDRRPEYQIMADKVRVKDYVANIIGAEHIIPTLGVWDRVEDIELEKLPNQFILKCNHDSGGLFICKDKSKLSTEDWSHALSKLKHTLNHDYYIDNREWCYKDMPRKILAEQLLANGDCEKLPDYKIFCFHGEPKFTEIDYDRFIFHKLNVYDMNWNFIDFYMTSPNDKSRIFEKPAKFDEMMECARKLSKNIPFVRTDFYCVDNKIYFGELTLYPGGGMIDFHPKEYDYKVGQLLDLSKI